MMDPSQPVIERWGASLNFATTAVLAVHGPGQDASHMRDLAARVADPGAAYFAPQAPGGHWFPERVTEPFEVNQPELDESLEAVLATLTHIMRSGFAPARTVLLGFSQGACLLAHHIVTSRVAFGGAVLLGGGYLGPDGTAAPVTSRWDGRPVFLGLSREDPWVPLSRAEETADVLRRRGADVELRVYRGARLAPNDDQVRAARDVLARVRGEQAA